MTYDITRYTDRLSALRFFPAKPQAVAAIADMLIGTCSSEDEAAKLVALTLARFDEWPGPSALRKLYRDEIAARRPAEARPEGCERCRDMEGLRRVFEIVERGSQQKELIWPEGSLHDSIRVGDELRRRYAGSKTHGVYELVAFCSCPLGRQRREQTRQASGV